MRSSEFLKGSKPRLSLTLLYLSSNHLLDRIDATSEARTAAALENDVELPA